MRVVLCKRERGEKKILFVCRCQVELCRDLVMSVWQRACMCVFWRNYYGRLCIYTAWQNHFVDCVENQWHISFSARLSATRRRSTWSTWWRSDSTSNLWHFSPDSLSLPLLSPPSQPLMSSCASLCFPCSCWQRLNVTPSAVACFCVGVYEGECFISAALGMDCAAWLGLAWLGLACLQKPSAGAHARKLCVCAYELMQGEFSNLISERNELHFSSAKLTEGSGRGWREKERERGEEKRKPERELVNSVWAGSLSPESEHGGLSLLVPESSVKCPVEETHGQQPKESQCDQQLTCLCQRRGIF